MPVPWCIAVNDILMHWIWKLDFVGTVVMRTGPALSIEHAEGSETGLAWIVVANMSFARGRNWYEITTLKNILNSFGTEVACVVQGV